MAKSLTVSSKAGTVLELTPDEATFLLDVMNMIGGDPTYSRRRHADRIGAALMEGKVPTSTKHLCDPIEDVQDNKQAIYFKDIEPVAPKGRKRA